MPEEHAEYGGSTISRTLNCYGWKRWARKLPKPKSSEFADRGNVLHDGMETIYLNEEEDFDPKSIIGSTYKKVELTEALYHEKIVPAVAAVEKIFKDYKVSTYSCEEKVTLLPNAWGTADMLARGSVFVDAADDSGDKIELCVGICLDYKFGDGIQVSAVENDQGVFYSTAGAETPETAEFFEGIDVLVIIIVQPNTRGEDDYTVWEVEPSIIPKMKREVIEAIELCEEDDAECTAGTWCAFCPGDGLCEATNGELIKMRRLDLKAPDVIANLPSFEELKQVEKTLKALRKMIHKQLEEGCAIPGYKLVPKRANRSYDDDKAVKAIIKSSRKLKYEDAYESEVKSPTQLEITCKAKGLDFDDMFGDHVVKISSGTTLAAENDKREGLPSLGALQLLLTQN